MAVPFDARRLETTDRRCRLSSIRGRINTGEACFGVSRTGFLVYGPGTSVGAAQRTLVWIDRDGKEESLPVPPRTYVYPRVSPDGSRIALAIADQENDIWVWDLTRRNLTRLTSDPGVDTYAAWTPDGRRIVFSSTRSGRANLYWQASDGSGQAERLLESPLQDVPNAVTPDGTRLLFRRSDPKNVFDVYALPLTGERRPTPLLVSSFVEQNAELSPYGRWLAYQSNDSGPIEIYVRPFPNVDSGRTQIPAGWGTRPVWSRDGRELFYLGGTEALPRMMVASIGTGAAFSAGTARALFEGRYYAPAPGGTGGRTYDVSPDGKRFLMIKEIVDESSREAGPPLVAVLNFFDELKRLAPPKR
jgi:serine/threonine-protein kinase